MAEKKKKVKFMSYSRVKNPSGFSVVRQYADLRRVKGLRQIDVADLTGLALSTIAAYENGSRVPNLENMMKLVQAVGGKDIELTGWSQLPAIKK